MPLRNYDQVSFAGTIGLNKERECESLIDYLEGYVITFTFVGNKSPISSLNSHTAWEQFCFILRVQALLAAIRYHASTHTRIP